MLNSRERNAVAKAVELGTAATVERVQYGVYRVPSASGTISYLVTVHPSQHGTKYVCDCQAGRAEQPCYHAAAVLIAKVEHASRVRVIGPAPLPAPTLTVLPGERMARALAAAAEFARVCRP